MKSKLQLQALEARDVPTQWYTVALDSPAQGVQGDSPLSVTAGGLTAAAEVWAHSPATAVKLALTGQVTVSGQTYGYNLQSVGTAVSDRTPFLLTQTTIGYEVRLEDLAGAPQQADWDYNDTTWAVSVNLADKKEDTSKPITVGGITYPGLDDKGRPGKITGTIKGPQTPGPKEFPDKVIPPGYIKGTHQKGHLLPASLGGIADPRNCIAIFPDANRLQGAIDSAMSQYLKANPNATLTIEITPNYKGDSLIPESITIKVKSDDGKFTIDVTIDNKDNPK